MYRMILPFLILLLALSGCQVVSTDLARPEAATPTRIAASSTPLATERPTSTPTATSAPPSPTPKPSTGTVLLIFGDRFIELIYTTIRPALEDAGYDIVVASRTLESLNAKGSSLNVEPDLLLEDVQVENYAAVAFLCDNDLTFGSARAETDRIAQQAVAQGVVLAAICSGPRILAYAQVVEGLTVTGEPSQTCEMLRDAGGTCSGRRVERDGLVVTARDGYASQPFVREILAAIEEANAAPSSESSSGILVFYSDRDGNPEIYTLNLADGDVQRLTNDPAFDDSPAISPDGTQVAFLTARRDPNPRFPNLKYEIYVMDIDGGNLRRLTETEAAEDHPAWSPDGSKILFDADYDGDGFYELYTMNPDGTDITRLTANAANDQFADWSPDGAQIAFSSDRDGNWGIYIMDADGSNQRPLTINTDWELMPAWSPDGEQIAFIGLVPSSRNTDVFVMNADGSQVRQLTDTPGFDESPAWSPDGSRIAFQTERDGNFEIYVMRPDGSEQRPLAIHTADDLWPSWGR